MSDPSLTPNPEPSPEGLEELLVRALERLDAEGATGVESLLAEHPQHAPQLRRHLERLARVGLTEGEGPQRPDAHPERLGDFRLLAPLGQGGMGIVYRAVQVSLDREVALKLIRPDQLFFAGARERFNREVAMVARMQHPGIVPVYAVGTDGGIPYFAMELVRGSTLAEVITRLEGRDAKSLTGRDLDAAVAACLGEPADGEPAELFRGDWVPVVLRIVREVAEALEHAHRRGVVHRDVKPSNVMLTRDGRVLLLDFGLAGADDAERLTRTGSALGSLAYMPPELLAGTAATPARCDVYSLGATCWEMLALRLPYQSSDPVQLQKLAGAAARPKLSTCNAAVTWDVETVLATALEPDPQRRYATASLFARDLDNVLAHRPIEARDPGVALRLRRWSQRHPARATAAVALAAVLVGGPSLWAWQEGRGREHMQAQRDELAKTNQALDRAKTRADVESARARHNLAKLQQVVDTMLTKVGDKSLRDIPRMEKVRNELLTEALRLYEGFLADQPADPALLLEASRVRLRAAEVQGMLGDFAAAEAKIERAVADMAPMAEHDEALEIEVVRARSRLATTQRLRGNLDGASTTAAAALVGWQALAARSADVFVAKGLGDAQVEANYIAADRGDLAGALAHIEGGLADLAAWRQKNGPGPELGHLEARMLDRAGVVVYQLAMSLRERGLFVRQMERAIELHTRAASLWPALLALAPNDTAVRADAAASCVALAIVLQAVQKMPEAKDALEKAVALFAALAADFPFAQRRQEQLANARLNLAAALAALGEAERCQTEVALASDAFERLSKESPDNDEFALGLCHALQTRAVATWQFANRPQDAVPMIVAAGAAAERALAARPANPTYRMVRRKVSETEAELHLELGDHVRATAAARGLIDERLAPTQPVLAAALLARAAAAATADQGLAEPERAKLAAACHEEARALLAAAVAGGLQLGRLRADPNLSGQWGSPAFEELIKEVQPGR